MGKSYGIELILITWESIEPRVIPIREEVVNWETDFPEMSPILFLLANLTLMEALLAAANKKQIFLPTLAILASAKKAEGNLKVRISI